MRSLGPGVVLAALSGCLCLPAAISVCLPTNCAGCCDAAGACRRGDTAALCGSAANTCVTCAGTETCEARACSLDADGLEAR